MSRAQAGEDAQYVSKKLVKRRCVSEHVIIGHINSIFNEDSILLGCSVNNVLDAMLMIEGDESFSNRSLYSSIVRECFAKKQEVGEIRMVIPRKVKTDISLLDVHFCRSELCNMIH